MAKKKEAFGSWKNWVMGIVLFILLVVLFYKPGILMSPSDCSEGYSDSDGDGVCEPENTETVSDTDCVPPTPDSDFPSSRYICKEYSYYAYQPTLFGQDWWSRSPTTGGDCGSGSSNLRDSCVSPNALTPTDYNPINDIPPRARVGTGSCWYCEEPADPSGTSSSGNTATEPEDESVDSEMTTTETTE